MLFKKVLETIPFSGICIFVEVLGVGEKSRKKLKIFFLLFLVRLVGIFIFLLVCEVS